MEKCLGTVREFRPHDLVYMRSYTRDSRWIPVVIIEVTGPLSFPREVEFTVGSKC